VSDRVRRLALVADFDIPTDLIQLRRQFNAAADAWAAATDPASTQAAYQEAGRLAEAIDDHPWWGMIEGRHTTHMALIAAARQNDPTGR
jgi:hypothetical protein